MVVALYARVSTTKQAEKDLSIPDQLHQMREWCKRQGCQVGPEYIEPGASATDDRRPAFQQMIADACQAPPPFDAIIVHSLSRFFRDSIEHGLYERRLNRAGVKLVSITQQTSDDNAGQMARKIFTLFDEYQSKENSKHTLRAMQENARQGFFNGSTPPYGFRTVEMEQQGRRDKKKRLAVDPAEAAIVRRIFDFYLNGVNGNRLGIKGITEHLNGRGITRRGQRWSKPTVFDILRDSTYFGDYFFNKKEAKSRRLKPPEEWIKIEVEPIIPRELFEQVQRLREGRSPQKINPSKVNPRTLLTGLLKCGSCGAGMTLATGKSGRYRYYKCTSRINVGNASCDSKNIPVEKLDQAILQALSAQIFTPNRVGIMLAEMRQKLRKGNLEKDNLLSKLNEELRALNIQSERLFEAVEKGFLPMDISLKERAHRHQARRQEILTEIAGLRRKGELPLAQIGPKSVEAFCAALGRKLTDKSSNFGKEYLRLLVEEIEVSGNTVLMRGGYTALAGVLKKAEAGSLEGVPTSVSYWLPGPDSNQRQGG